MIPEEGDPRESKMALKSCQRILEESKSESAEIGTRGKMGNDIIDVGSDVIDVGNRGPALLTSLIDFSLHKFNQLQHQSPPPQKKGI